MSTPVLALVLSMSVIIALLCFYSLRLRREMRRMVKQFEEFLFEKTRKRLDIGMKNAELECLAEMMNQSISEQEQLRIQGARREQNLRQDLANISHDLRTPLTAILGYLGLAERETDTPLRESYYRIVRQKATQLHELVDTFFELTALDASLREVRLCQIDLNKALQEELLSAYAEFEKRGITPAIHLPEQPVCIMGEQLAVERILQNLISNALCYTTGKIEVTLEKQGAAAILSIRNTCPPISPAEQERIFQQFYRKSGANEGGHAGLGLYIVKALTQKLRGSVDADYSEGALNLCLSFPLAK